MNNTKTNNKFIYLLIIVVIVFITTVVSNYLNKNNYNYTININKVFQELNIEKVDSTVLINSINLGGEYLINSLESNGQFRYKVNIDSNIIIKPKYNTLRHAGAIYALCMYYEFSGNKKALAAATEAAGFLTDELIMPLDKYQDLLGVWSLGTINNDKDPDIVKLGGNGLGLLALAYLEKLQPGTIKIDQLRRMGDFILFMQKDNGSFYSKYFPGKKGRDDSWTSLYYPGEAALGLLMLYEIDKNPKWLTASEKALEYLAQLRKGKLKTEADHWALIASARLLIHFNELEYDVLPQVYINHGIQVCKSIIMEMPQFSTFSPYYGCLTADGRTTPTSTRLEGLLGFVNYIPENRESLIYSVLLVSNKAIAYLLRAQIKEGVFSGGMTRELYNPEIDLSKFIQTQDTVRNSEIRIDYVQHALSAWMQYYDLVYKY